MNVDRRCPECGGLFSELVPTDKYNFDGHNVFRHGTTIGQCDRVTSREVRKTSRTGGSKGVKPERYDLVPWDSMDAVARVYAFGALKYSDNNWRKGYPFGDSIAAALRHITAFAMGEDNDPESGEPHPAHAIFHMLSLIAWLQDERYAEHDNRVKVRGQE